MHVSEITSWHRTAYMSWCFDICTHPPAVNGPESVFSILEEMRVAQTASRALSRNLTMDLPPDYTPLSLAEVFYMATMGGAKGTYLQTELHKCYASYTTWAEWYSDLLCMYLYLAPSTFTLCSPKVIHVISVLQPFCCFNTSLIHKPKKPKQISEETWGQG